MFGITYQLIVCASSVRMFKDRIEKYLLKTGYT